MKKSGAFFLLPRAPWGDGANEANFPEVPNAIEKRSQLIKAGILAFSKRTTHILAAEKDAF